MSLAVLGSRLGPPVVGMLDIVGCTVVGDGACLLLFAVIGVADGCGG